MQKDKRILESAQRPDEALNAQWKSGERDKEAFKSAREAYQSYCTRAHHADHERDR
jgi:hypothetical protein